MERTHLLGKKITTIFLCLLICINTTVTWIFITNMSLPHKSNAKGAFKLVELKRSHRTKTKMFYVNVEVLLPASNPMLNHLLINYFSILYFMPKRTFTLWTPILSFVLCYVSRRLYLQTFGRVDWVKCTLQNSILCDMWIPYVDHKNLPIYLMMNVDR